MFFKEVKETSFEDMEVEAGLLLYNFDITNPGTIDDDDIISATTGGMQFSCVPTYEDFGADVDNVMNNTKELKRLTGWDVTLTTSVLESNVLTIKTALGAAHTGSSQDTSDKKYEATEIVPDMELKSSHFKDIWACFDLVGGGWLAIKILNALSTGGYTLQTTKSGKGTSSITITGHVSIDDQTTVPAKIYVAAPVTASTTPTTNP